MTEQDTPTTTANPAKSKGPSPAAASDPIEPKKKSSPKGSPKRGASPDNKSAAAAAASPPKDATLPKDTDSPKGTTAAAAASPDAETGLLPAEHWAQLQAEEPEDQSDADSAVGSNASSSTSLASSILRYRTIHGRTFHSDQGNAQYWGSNDATQNEALDIMHHVLSLMLDGKLHLAPLKQNIQTAIDIGTGTGIWAIDFSDAYPNASVIGTDVSPIQPSWVPPNLQFQIDDCTQEWTFQEGSADYVHLRWLLGSVADWTTFMQQAFKTLKPGGYLESHEGTPNITSDDGTVHDRTAMSQWGRFFVEGGRKLGRPFTLIEDAIIKKAMEDAGFVDIHVTDFKCPIGSWPRDSRLSEMGEYMRMAFEQDAEGAVLFMADLQGWARDEILVYAAHLRREMANSRYHPYFRSQVIYGRKPE